MKRPLAALLFLLLLRGAQPALATEDEPILRNWMLGLQVISVHHDTHDVFDHPALPGQPVDERSPGGGLQFGRRFGDRFLLGLQLDFSGQQLAETDWDIMDVEALITGTVLFREREVLQPFLRAGFGGGGTMLYLPEDQGNVFSFGTVANAGGGLQLRLSSRFSLEFEAVATFSNHLEVRNESDDPRFPDEETWQVRTSRTGLRTGVGVQWWF